MIEIEKPQIECIETPGDASYGKYVIEPLERALRNDPGQCAAAHPALLPARHGGDQHQDRRRAA